MKLLNGALTSSIKDGQLTMSSRLSSIAPAYHSTASLTTNRGAQRLAISNSNRHTYPSQDSCVPQLVAARAASMPDAPALTAGNEAVTYRELNERANQLAHQLIALGVRPESPDNLVALCLDRSVTAVVCALGILKAGGAYLPLDPSYPTDRLAFMLSDAQPRVLITRQEMEIGRAHV